MYPLLRRPLFWLPPETAHHASLWALSLFDASPALCRRMRAGAPADGRLSVTIAGLKFPNPIGLAAGFDKDAEAVQGLFALGFGSVEVGTVTPRPQSGNEPPRLFRLPGHRALVNRMGFNNRGASAMAARLRELEWRPGPVGVNLGKNRETPLERATEDYLAGVDALAPCADYLVVNASSPNTPGLRTLQEPEALAALLAAVRARLGTVAPGKPLFLKIAPDLAPEAVDAIVDVALAQRIDGLIATNTTLSRPVSGDPDRYPAGGLSGAPLRGLANAVIRRAHRRGGARLPIIGAGGVFTADDAYEKILAGASLVQVYTGFVYEGPAVARRILQGLVALLERGGFASVADAVGAEGRARGRSDTAVQ